MRLFKKKPASNATLAELESYYGVKRGNSNSRSAMLKSAALAAATVFVASALVFVLFLGVRGIYRVATDNEDTQKTVVSEPKKDESKKPGSPEGAGSTPTNTPPTTTAPTTPPSTQTNNLPQTGPTEDL